MAIVQTHLLHCLFTITIVLLLLVHNVKPLVHCCGTSCYEEVAVSVAGGSVYSVIAAASTTRTYNFTSSYLATITSLGEAAFIESFLSSSATIYVMGGTGASGTYS